MVLTSLPSEFCSGLVIGVRTSGEAQSLARSRVLTAMLWFLRPAAESQEVGVFDGSCGQLGANLHLKCCIGGKGRETWTPPQLKEVVSTSPFLLPSSWWWLEREEMLSCPCVGILGRTL